MKKIWYGASVITGVVAVVLGFLILVVAVKWMLRSVTTAGGTPPAVVTLRSITTEFHLTIDEFMEEIASNKFDADKRYSNKRIELSGTVARITTDYNGHPVVKLHPDWRCPDCLVADVSGLRVGDRVIVVGYWGSSPGGYHALLDAKIK